MITPSFGLTATERVLPKLALDFTTASLDSRVTFTRTTDATHPATYTNSSGYVTSATNNQPRFDYDPVTLVCKGLLIEEQRDNLLIYSAQFENATWIKTRSSITDNAVVSPDGTTTGDKLVEDTTAASTHTIASSNVTVVSGGTYAFSVYLKAGERTKARIVYIINGGNGILANADLSAGTISAAAAFGTATAGTSSIQALGNGWYRCVVTGSSTAGTIGQVQIELLDAAGNRVYNGNGTSGLYLWGAQLEAGAFPTSYIPTTSAALTRNADVATMTGTNFSSWFNQTQGAFYAEGYGGTVRGCFAAIDDDTMNNRYQMNISAVGPYSPNFAAVSGGVVSADLYMSAVTQSANIKQVGTYKLDSFALSAFGATPQTDTSGVLPVSVSMLRFGRLQNGNNPLNGCLKKFYYWPQRLTDAEVQAFSK